MLDTLERLDDYLLDPKQIDAPLMVLCSEHRTPAVLEINGWRLSVAWPQDVDDATLLDALSVLETAGWQGLRVDSLSPESLRYFLTETDAPLLLLAPPLKNRHVVVGVEFS